MNYLQELWAALDFGSLRNILLRLASVFLCLTTHETCHGLAAYALGDPTAKRMHRLSLNPLRHIDWMGLLMMVTLGFGWAKPVPVDPRYFKKPKQGMALTALAESGDTGLSIVYGGALHRSGPFQSGANPAAGRCQGAVLPAAGSDVRHDAAV